MNNISVLYSEEELALSVKKLGAEITAVGAQHLSQTGNGEVWVFPHFLLFKQMV